MEPPPDVGRIRPRSILIVVVLPAPFGPTKPQTAPLGMAKLTPSTTVRSPKRFVSPVVDTASDDLGGSPVRHVTCVIVMREPYRQALARASPKKLIFTSLSTPSGSRPK